jgi:hypothetical protein
MEQPFPKAWLIFRKGGCKPVTLELSTKGWRLADSYTDSYNKVEDVSMERIKTDEGIVYFDEPIDIDEGVKKTMTTIWTSGEEQESEVILIGPDFERFKEVGDDSKENKE